MTEQRTEEWRLLRAGKITGTRVAALMATTANGNPAASRKNLIADLVTERMTGKPVGSGFVSAAMQWGIDNEPAARHAYSVLFGEIVEEVGFVLHPEHDWAGASPDGLVASDGLVEIKCPNTSTHIEFLLTGHIDRDYILQMQWQMECTSRQWCDFVSFDPRMDDGLQIKTRRIQRDSEEISRLVSQGSEAIAEADGIIKRLKTIKEHA